MRTKTLLAAAAIIAVGAVSSKAQGNVYSLNVVGYVNRTVPAFAFAFLSNPLQNTDNQLSTIIPNPPDGTAVFRWNEALQDFDPTIPTYFDGLGWAPDAAIAPGEGFLILGGDEFTATFVGEVRQGALSTPIGGNFGFSAVGSQVPVGGSLANNVLVGYPAADGDAVFIWNEALQDYDPTIPTYFEGLGWTPDATMNVGDGFLLLRGEGPVNWVRNFTVE